MNLQKIISRYSDISEAIKNKQMFKRFFLLVAFLCVLQVSYAQITITKVAPPKEIIPPYDSMQNFLGENVYAYVGQELYLKGMHEGLRDFGYAGFFKNYKTREVYNCCQEKYNAKYEGLVGKFFYVNSVIKTKEQRRSALADVYYLELHEKKSKDKVYFEYDHKYKNSFPFVVTGFFEKQKELCFGKEFIIKGINWMNSTKPMTDIYTGLPVTFERGSVWKCIDFTIEDQYYTVSLIIENDKEERIPLPWDNIHSTSFVTELNE